MSDIRLRIAGPRDAAALLDIYAPYVEKTAITFEYAVPGVEEFEARIAHVLERYPYLAAERNGTLVGYAYAGRFHARPAYDWAAETSIYVREDQRRTGVGRRLYQALEAALSLQHVLNLNACVASPEQEDEYLTRNSILFHTHMGYRPVGEFHQCGYKFGRWYNMAYMEKHIGAHVDRPPTVIPFSDVQKLFAQRYGVTAL